jgi:DNA primase
MSVVDEVKSRIDIADLVGEQVPLKRAGRNFSGLCPFHSERTPSFIVSPERQTWHCFGACATGGDVFTFVMKRENIDFGEALRMLAQRAGVMLAERRDPQEDEREQRLLQANEAAAAFFHNALLHAKQGTGARDYLQQRGLDAETIEAFQLGYSPDSWDALRQHLVERGFDEAELLAAGLLVESDRGGYDRFRNRLMFPIRDERGRVVGFGARQLATESNTPDTGAKYINTPQSPVFDKSALLYALDRAKEAIRRERTAIVVEGYMDAIAAHQHGITNVVASMGTALTERQIRALERLKGRVLLALDADAAGIEATLRALQEAGEAGAIHTTAAAAGPADLSEEEFSHKVREWSRDALKRAAVNFYVVPLSGKDPDEMIRKDRNAWDVAVAEAKPFTDHIFEVVASRKDLSQPAARAALLQELLPVVRLIDEPVYRAHYLQRLARLGRVSEDVLRSELSRRPRSTRRERSYPVDAPLARVHREAGEEFCLALLLRHPLVRPEGEALSDDLFLLSEHRAIFDAWRASPDMETVREALPEALHPYLDRILERELPFLDGTRLREALEDCVRRIERDRLRQAKLASAAALSELNDEEMGAAVTEAVMLQETRGASMPEHPSQRAAILVEDDEMGRRLHQPPRGPDRRSERHSPAE